MKLDTLPPSSWTALLPGGRRETLDLAPGVRLCIGDVLRIGRGYWRVERRATAGAARAFVVEVSPARREAATA